MRRLLKLFCVVSLLSATIPVKAQLTIEQSGRVVVGTNRNHDDPLRAASLSVYGHAVNGHDYEYRPGAKITFGDFGSFPNVGWNAFVGELGEYDSDVLWLHGKNGICMTTWNGLFKIAEWGCFYEVDTNGLMVDPLVPTSAFTLKGDVMYDRTAQIADNSRKSDINQIEHPLERLMSVKCQYFHYTDPLDNILDKDALSIDDTPKSSTANA